jgi:hypothetical protein
MPTYLIAVCIVVLGGWWIIARMALQLRNEFQTEINRVSSALRALEERPCQQIAGDGDPANIASIRIIAEKSAGGQRTSPDTHHEAVQISGETQEAIRATLSAFLGRKIQIRSVKPLESHDAAMTWITQGRIAIQASHNQFVSHE